MFPTIAEVREGLFAYLDTASVEAVQHLRHQVLAGQINGRAITPTQFREGGCCIIGHIAIGLDIPDDIALRQARALARVCRGEYTSYEWYIQGIRPGHTPNNTMTLHRILGWLDEWLVAHAVQKDSTESPDEQTAAVGEDAGHSSPAVASLSLS